MTPATSAQVDALLLLVSATFVMAVVPGLAFFYGGMTGAKGASQAFRAALVGSAIVVLLAVLGGYGMLAGSPLIAHLVGRPDWGLADVFTPGKGTASTLYPLARAGYLIAVCAVAVTILGTAIASRVTLRAWAVFSALWSVLVLFPAGYAVFALGDGWAVAGMHVIDFGGAIPISLAAGSGAAGVILACGHRDHPVAGERRLPLVAAGGALVWVGWFGLTVGSEGALDAFAPLIALNTLMASAGGALMWIIVDRVLLRRPTVTSALCGAVAGLVAITPASGVLTIGWSLLLGALAAIACASMVDLAARARFGVPMTICVIHIVASLVGLLYIGLFANGDGMVDSGNFDLFVAQAVAGLGVAAYSFVVSLLIAIALRYTLGLTRLRYRADGGFPDEPRARDRERAAAGEEDAGHNVDQDAGYDPDSGGSAADDAEALGGSAADSRG
jgi:Amt family ammonium transporter